jgi:polyisoprenyl-phosphate glycosyltransferase
VPIDDDWVAAELLVERIDSVLGEYALSGQLLFMDDGSFDSLPEQFPKITPRNIQQIQRVELKTNLGHQRALCVGLVHLAQGDLAGPVVIMDADGEDAPSDISRLLNKFVREDKRKVIFAARGLRAEEFLSTFSTSSIGRSIA